MKKAPLERVKQQFKDKAGLVEAVKGLAKGDLWLDRANEDGGLGLVSNAKLLRLHEILTAHLSPLGVPVAYGFPVGHIAEQWTLPIGARARLDAAAGELELLEPAVS